MKECLASGRTLEDLSVEDWRRHSPLFGPWVKDALSLDRALAGRTSRGGTAPSEVRRQMSLLEKALTR